MTPQQIRVPAGRLARTVAVVAAVVFTACSDAEQAVAPPVEPSFLITAAGEYDLVDSDDVTVNGARWISGVQFKVGTGVINPFLSVQGSPEEEGFNTNASPLPYDDTRPNFTNPLPLNVVPTIRVNGTRYREIILDANEADNGVAAQFSIDIFDLWLCSDAGAATYSTYAQFESNGSCVKVYDLGTKDGVPARLLATDGKTNGSGNSLDYDILIPETAFESSGLNLASCSYNPTAPACGIFVILKVKMGGKGGDFVTGSTFEEFSTVLRPYVNVTKTASTSFTRTFAWTVDKSVSPATWSLFNGDSGTSTYTIQVTKGAPTESSHSVSGNIVISNPSSGAAVITSVSDVISGGGGASINVLVSCPVSFPHSLAVGGTLTCSYTQALSNSNTRLNTASVELESGTISQASAPVDFANATATDVLGAIDVDDSNGQSFQFSGSGQVTYDRTFTCGADQGTHGNTATIRQTGASDNASVTVACYALAVSKTAATQLRRTWSWTIAKVIDPSAFLAGTYDAVSGIATVQDGQALSVEYDITINASSADSQWRTTGTITVSNPNPTLAATVSSLSDVVSPAIDGAVTCASVTFPVQVAAGGSFTCTYVADLPDAAGRTNTATATLQNHAYDPQGVGTPTGTSQAAGNAAVSFAAATVEEIDECVNVEDVLTQGGAQIGSTQNLGSYCANQTLPKTFTVTRDFGGANGFPIVCGNNVFDNVATATSNDTNSQVSDPAAIDIVVACSNTCTLTQGYWKTHNRLFNGGRHADATWELLDGGQAENTPFFLSGQSWYQVFWTAPAGNVYYNLAHQYMAAVLNGHAGADQSAVASALAEAKTLLENNTPADAAALRGAARQPWVNLAGALGSYNQGITGPGHCTENQT